MPLTKTRISRLALAFVSASALLFASHTLAQDNITTPTTAPTKTATAPASAATPAAVSTPSAGFQPFTQADLSLLTANVQRPNGLIWHEGYLYAACTGDTTVYEINSDSGQTRAYIAGVRNAHTFYAEGGGSSFALWVPDFGTNVLSLVTRTNIRTIGEGLNGPWGIAFLDEDHFLITNMLGNTLVVASRDGEVETILEGLAAPTGLILDGTTAYIANNGSTRRSIEWYDLNNPNDDTVNHVLVSGLQNTTGLQLAPDGYLYFAYAIGTRGVVGRVDPEECRANGGCTNEQVEVVVFTELEAPLAGLTITPDMRLFVHTMFIPTLYWLQLPVPEGLEVTAEATAAS